MREYLIPIMLALISVFAPIQTVLLTVICLVFADLLLGCMAAHKRGEKITSAGFRRSVTKLFVYELAIMMGYCGEIYLLGGVIPVMRLVAGLIGVVELKSLLENAGEITGIDFKSVIQKLGSKNDDQG